MLIQALADLHARVPGLPWVVIVQGTPRPARDRRRRGGGHAVAAGARAGTTPWQRWRRFGQKMRLAGDRQARRRGAAQTEPARLVR